MELAPSNVPLSFEVTFDNPSLHVAMSVYDDSGVTPTLISGPLPMLNVVGNTYRAKFTGASGKNYIIFKAVYTDNSFTTLSPDYSQGSESIVVQDITPSGPGNVQGQVIGLVTDNTVIGLVNC